MAKRVQYRTSEGVQIASTDHPTYQTRKRAARKAKEQGHSTLFEYTTLLEKGSVAGYQGHNLSHYIK